MIVELLAKNTKESIAEAYLLALRKELNKNCGECYNDAIILLTLFCRMKINVFINRYRHTMREQELTTCYDINKANPLLNVIEVPGRKYNDFFEAMREYPKDVNIISNADIFFNDTIELCKGINDNECYALSRWDYKEGKATLWDHKDSQDVWIFKGAPRNIDGHFELGKPGCDNAIAFNIKQAGYKISNPAKKIQAIHLHESNVHTYRDKDRLVGYSYHFIPVT